METINRAAIVVGPKEPYLAWARSLETNPPIDELPFDDRTSIYLVNAGPEYFDGADIVRRNWQGIFDEQLNSWCLDRLAWPKKRTLQMFLEWFDARVAEMVFDLGEGILHHDG